MFANLPVMLGQYRPLDSYLHRLDARAKLVPVFLVLILSLLTDSYLFYLLIQAALVVSLLFSGINYKTLIENFKPIFIIVLITSLYHLLFSGGDSDVVLDLSIFKFRERSIDMAIFYSLRLVIFISIAFLMTLTNSPSELGEAVYKILKPLRRIKVPVDDLALIIFIAIRFIPILYDEFISIKNAQIIRGVDFSGSIINRMKKTVAVIIPVFISAVQRADELALALQARGYRSNQERSFFSHAKIGKSEIIFILGSSAFVLLLYYFLEYKV